MAATKPRLSHLPPMAEKPPPNVCPRISAVCGGFLHSPVPESRCGSASPMWNTLQVDCGVALFEAPGQSTTTRRRCTCQHCKHRRPPAHLHLLLGLESQNRSVQTLTASRFTLIEHSYFPAHFRFQSGVPRQAHCLFYAAKLLPPFGMSRSCRFPFAEKSS